MRSRLFNLIFRAYCIGALLVVYPLTFLPSRGLTERAFRAWAGGVRFLMRHVMGIRVSVKGLDGLPKDRPYILAGKHQSECDGILLLATIPNLAFIAMKELTRIPLAGRILKKLDMVLIDTDGGRGERDRLVNGAERAFQQGRPILIYPEGTLMAVGHAGRYRAGVYHLARGLDLPVYPVATNIGLRWDRRNAVKTPGDAVVEILPPLRPGGNKAAFMQQLERRLETRSNELAKRQAGRDGIEVNRPLRVPSAAPATPMDISEASVTVLPESPADRSEPSVPLPRAARRCEPPVQARA